MSFLEHLDELRKRIIRALLSLCRRRGIAAFFIEDIIEFVMRPLAATLPAGRNIHLHLPDRSVHAVHPHRADRGALHRGAADFLAGLAVRRAGAVREGAALRHSVRLALEHRVRRRRRVLPLRGVSAHVAVLRELLERARRRSCRASRTPSACTCACCSAWRSVFQMPALVFFLAQDGRDHGALDDPPVQVRRAASS